MKCCASWLVMFLLFAEFHFSALNKDQSPSYRRERFGHSRSPKHNSIAKYYRDLHRPLVQKCVEPELPQRVADAAAIFTGKVWEIVAREQGRGRDGETVLVEIKRVMKGEDVVDRFSSTTDQLNHRAPHFRQERRTVAVTGLGGDRICRSRTRQYDTWIFFTDVVYDPSSRLHLNSSLTRLSLSNILRVEAALKGRTCSTRVIV